MPCLAHWPLIIHPVSAEQPACQSPAALQGALLVGRRCRGTRHTHCWTSDTSINKTFVLLLLMKSHPPGVVMKYLHSYRRSCEAEGMISNSFKVRGCSFFFQILKWREAAQKRFQILKKIITWVQHENTKISLKMTWLFQFHWYLNLKILFYIT